MGLRKKWVIYITIIIILLAFALTFFFIRRLKLSEKENLMRYGITLANNLAYNSEYGVLIANKDMLYTLIQGMMREKDVIYCVIQDKDGIMLSSGGMAGAIKGLKREGLGIYEVSSSILTEAPESFAGELDFFVTSSDQTKQVKIGEVRIGISMASANARMAKAQRAAILATIVVILIGIGVTYFLVGAIVTPIHRLAEGTQRLAKGDLDHRVHIDTKDEIGELGIAFNKMTDDLRTSRDELIENISELKKAQSQLIQAEKMETVGRLASGIAHEVKNPLAIILQCVEYLVKNVSSSDKNVSLTLGYIREAVRRADNVVRGLLDFSGTSRLDIGLCSINSIIERSLLLLKHQFDRYHIRIIKDIKEVLPFIELDENRIEQVFVNLFINAVAAMPAGGNLTVKSYYEEQDESVIVKIEDTGTGISEEILVKIFEPFFTTRRSSGGTGLGLSVVKNIMDLHNGKISVRNKKEGGVEVILVFNVKSKGG